MSAIRYVPFAGRLLIGLPFAMSGLSKLAAIGPTTDMIRAAGLPLPSLACDRGLIPQPLCRPEPNDPLPQELDDGRWAAPDRRSRKPRRRDLPLAGKGRQKCFSTISLVLRARIQ